MDWIAPAASSEQKVLDVMSPSRQITTCPASSAELHEAVAGPLVRGEPGAFDRCLWPVQGVVPRPHAYA